MGWYAYNRSTTANAPTSIGDYQGVLVLPYGVDKWRIFQIAFGCPDNSNAVAKAIRHSYHSNGQRLWSTWTTF